MTFNECKEKFRGFLYKDSLWDDSKKPLRLDNLVYHESKEIQYDEDSTVWTKEFYSEGQENYHSSDDVNRMIGKLAYLRFVGDYKMPIYRNREETKPSCCDFQNPYCTIDDGEINKIMHRIAYQVKEILGESYPSYNNTAEYEIRPFYDYVNSSYKVDIGYKDIKNMPAKTEYFVDVEPENLFIYMQPLLGKDESVYKFSLVNDMDLIHAILKRDVLFDKTKENEKTILQVVSSFEPVYTEEVIRNDSRSEKK